MLKKLLPFLLFGVMLLTGCDEETGAPEISIPDITPINGYHYALAEDCGDGCIYKRYSDMWYYDYKSKTAVPFCADPACKHEDKTCAAYMPGRVFGYKDKFIIAGNEMKWEAENCVDDDMFVLEEFDIASQTKRELMRLDNCRWCETYAYGDKLYIGILEEYHLEGDNVHQSSSRNRIYFMTVSLDTGEAEYMSECLLDAFNMDFSFYGINDGKLFFDLIYYTENYWDSEAEDFKDAKPEQHTKHMAYDIKTKEISELNDYVRTSYLNGCKVYADGKSVVFDCGDKVCRLTSDYELTPYLPFTPMQYSNRKVYSGAYYVNTREEALFIYDTETEKTTTAKLPWSDYKKIVTERENEFIFADYGSSTEPMHLITLSKAQLALSELTPEQYNAFCKDDYDAYVKAKEEFENAEAD